jgi:pimeloyl-ACP methyl ester carboxylesterase
MKSLMGAAALCVMSFICGCITAPPTEPRRIEQAGYRPIGGIEQWVTIRGDDTNKPLLLLIHGGPGDVQSPFVSTYAAYEREFILVQWDQRGAGRTFQRYGKETPGLNLERLTEDGIELSEQLHKQFPKNRLVLLGHSWGSIVATAMVQKRPDLFSAYVGTGQVASWSAVVNHQFDFLLAAARTNGDAATVAALERIGRPDPLNAGQYFGVVARTLRANQPDPDKAWLASIPAQLREQGATDEQLNANSSGTTFSATTLMASLTHADLQTSASAFSIPYCVIQGQHDLNTPTAAAKTYFDRITAPKKRFAIIDTAGHFAVATHQPEFIADIKKCLGR